MSETQTEKPDAVQRLVGWLRGQKNRVAWWHYELRRRRRARRMLGWMRKRHGKETRYMGFAWQWRVSGVLVTIFHKVPRLKIYLAGGKQTACYEIAEKRDRMAAMKAIENLPSNSQDMP